MNVWIANICVFAFLFWFGFVGFWLLKSPLRLAEQATRWGIVMPFLEGAHTKMGRLQIRALGFVFLLGSLIFGALICSPRSAAPPSGTLKESTLAVSPMLGIWAVFGY